MLLGPELAQMVFTDPPYNVPIEGHASGLGQQHHPDFVMASGEMFPGQYTDFLREALRLCAQSSANGSLHFVCMDWRSIFELLLATRAAYSEQKNLCVWAKNNGGMGSLYRSQYELVGVFKHGRAPHINNVQLGSRGRHRTNLWQYPGASSFGKDRQENLEAHPTVKPVRMVADAILDCSKVNGLILDPFGGSGTTILACERTRRRAAVIEIDPHYVDVAIQRFEKATKVSAKHVETGLTFDALRASRTGSAGETP